MNYNDLVFALLLEYKERPPFFASKKHKFTTKSKKTKFTTKPKARKKFAKKKDPKFKKAESKFEYKTKRKHE